MVICHLLLCNHDVCVPSLENKPIKSSYSAHFSFSTTRLWTIFERKKEKNLDWELPQWRPPHCRRETSAPIILLHDMQIHHLFQNSPPIATNCSKKQAHKKANCVLYFTILAGEAVWPDICSWIFRWWCYEYALECRRSTISTQIYELV